MNNSFRTEIQQQKAEHTIAHKDAILLIGSCFAENMGEKLREYKFATQINPFGILFNPVSIAQSLNMLTDTFLFKESDLHFHNGEWVSFSHHGKFSHPDKEECLKNINEQLLASRAFLQKADWLILTLGTTVAYRYKGNIVANCHKVPQKEFQKQLLTVEDTVSALRNSIENIKSVKKDIRILFTVSPVRYIKNDLTENALSKAQLLVSVYELLHSTENSCYFPAFEIMVDDLRDYRFYNDDMIHPSPLAINYIWNQFSHSFFNKETWLLNALIEEIVAAKNHRLKTPSSDESQRFKKEQLQKIQKIQSLSPHVDFEEEIKYFSL